MNLLQISNHKALHKNFCFTCRQRKNKRDVNSLGRILVPWNPYFTWARVHTESHGTRF